jgi:hypothetical protein
MIADRAYSPGSLPFLDRRASLFYFAAAVPAVGFVHGSADVNPLDAAMLESTAEGSFIDGRPTIDTVGCRKGSMFSR